MAHKHKWEALGGCRENPGCFDRGNGRMIFVALCHSCGQVKVEGTNYAAHSDEADWKRIYASRDEYLRRVWGRE